MPVEQPPLGPADEGINLLAVRAACRCSLGPGDAAAGPGLGRGRRGRRRPAAAGGRRQQPNRRRRFNESHTQSESKSESMMHWHRSDLLKHVVASGGMLKHDLMLVRQLERSHMFVY